VVIVAALIGISQFGYYLTEPLRTLEQRIELRSAKGRFAVYSAETVGDAMETLLFGRGANNAFVTAAGITPHNSIIYTHIAFGGITSSVYVAWLIILGVRIYRMILGKELNWDTKLFVLAVAGMALATQLLTNVGYLVPSVFFATGIIEKYTAPYSRRRIAEREAEQAWYQAYGAPAQALS